MSEKTLGIDIGIDAVKVVHVTGGPKAPVITAFSTIPLNDASSLNDSLNKIAADARFASDLTICSIDCESLFFRSIEIPLHDDKKIRKIVPFEMELLLPVPAEDLHMDFIRYPKSAGANNKIFVAAIEKSRIRHYLEALEQSKLNPAIIDVKGIPLALNLIEKKGIANGVLIDISWRHSTLVLWRDNFIKLVRLFPFGENYSESADKSNPLQPAWNSDRILRINCSRILRTIHAFSTHQEEQFQIEMVYVNGGKKFGPQRVEIVSQCFGSSAVACDLQEGIEVQSEDEEYEQWDASVMNNALALALRPHKKWAGFNFRQGEFAPKGGALQHRHEILQVAIAFAVILFCMIVNLGIRYYLMDMEHKQLEKAIVGMLKEAVPDVKKIVNPVQQLKTRLEEEKAAKGGLTNVIKGVTVLDLIQDISRLLPASVDIQIDVMLVDPKTIQLTGNTNDFDAVDAIKGALQKSDYFQPGDTVPSKRDNSGERVEFKLALTRS
ncbi:MAG: type II secretion system protein GspL [Pseudomonadota bacterium]